MMTMMTMIIKYFQVKAFAQGKTQIFEVAPMYPKYRSKSGINDTSYETLMVVKLRFSL